jgi:hypothetical protein
VGSGEGVLLGSREGVMLGSEGSVEVSIVALGVQAVVISAKIRRTEGIRKRFMVNLLYFTCIN